ncbi:MAG: 3-dehydroquinate dehydratase [Oscillospiraceae bacterium]|nr:3-dehydroquinate dehydratase [Candidatus Equicaccousia limihippi]
MKILFLYGPNLDMLGKREPSVYGNMTLKELNKYTKRQLKGEAKTCFYQTNSEEKLIKKIHRAGRYDGVVINAGALTHYSYALYDAIKCVDTPFAEAHISDIFSREDFRKTSVIAPACVFSVSGKGKDSGVLAARELIK